MDNYKRVVFLELNDNPFALAILEHLKGLETRVNPKSRLIWKLQLPTTLFNRGWEWLVI